MKLTVICDKKAISIVEEVFLDSASCKTMSVNESSEHHKIEIDENKSDAKSNSYDTVQELETVEGNSESKLNSSCKNSDFSILKETNPQYCDDQLDDNDSKIVCSLELSKINRIPMKILVSNSLPEKKKSECSPNENSVIFENLNASLVILKDSVTTDLQESSETKTDSSIIKKEVLTPPSFELNRNDQN